MTVYQFNILFLNYESTRVCQFNILFLNYESTRVYQFNILFKTFNLSWSNAKAPLVCRQGTLDIGLFPQNLPRKRACLCGIPKRLSARMPLNVTTTAFRIMVHRKILVASGPKRNRFRTTIGHLKDCIIFFARTFASLQLHKTRLGP